MKPLVEQEVVTLETLSRLAGPVVVEFGAGWCGICRAFAPFLQQLLETHPTVRHIKIEDGKGRPLGRSFQVTLWPTLIFLLDGQVQQRLVRPGSEEVRQAIEQIV